MRLNTWCQTQSCTVPSRELKLKLPTLYIRSPAMESYSHKMGVTLVECGKESDTCSQVAT